MNIPQGSVNLDVRQLRLIDSIEAASASLRKEGKDKDAVALFRLRSKIREGFSLDEAKSIFDIHTKTLLEEKK